MRTEQEVEKIVQENAGLVTALVNRTLRKYPRLPGGFDREDLRGIGNLALVNAARTFDPQRGAAFSTYAYRCIYLAILGALKREWDQQIDIVLISQMPDEDEDRPIEEQFADPAPDAGAIVLSRCDRDLLEKAIARLPERQAELIRMIYFEEESVAQVAKAWRISTYAVQTLHMRALRALRLQLRRLGIRDWDGLPGSDNGERCLPPRAYGHGSLSGLTIGYSRLSL